MPWFGIDMAKFVCEIQWISDKPFIQLAPSFSSIPRPYMFFQFLGATIIVTVIDCSNYYSNYYSN